MLKEHVDPALGGEVVNMGPADPKVVARARLLHVQMLQQDLAGKTDEEQARILAKAEKQHGGAFTQLVQYLTYYERMFRQAAGLF